MVQIISTKGAISKAPAGDFQTLSHTVQYNQAFDATSVSDGIISHLLSKTPSFE